jgi:hypothetical protein
MSVARNGNYRNRSASSVRILNFWSRHVLFQQPHGLPQITFYLGRGDLAPAANLRNDPASGRLVSNQQLNDASPLLLAASNGIAALPHRAGA